MRGKIETDKELTRIKRADDQTRSFELDDYSEIAKYFFKRDLELIKEYDYSTMGDEALE